jgi:hypothetical protein
MAGATRQAPRCVLEVTSARARSRGALHRYAAARGIAVPEEARARILACRDDAQLNAWIQRAAVAHALAEVLG